MELDEMKFHNEDIFLAVNIRIKLFNMSWKYLEQWKHSPACVARRVWTGNMASEF